MKSDSKYFSWQWNGSNLGIAHLHKNGVPWSLCDKGPWNYTHSAPKGLTKCNQCKNLLISSHREEELKVLYRELAISDLLLQESTKNHRNVEKRLFKLLNKEITNGNLSSVSSR